MASTFFLTIPCQLAKYNPNEVRPVYVWIGDDETGAALTKYICPFCQDEYTSRRACEKHMGIGVMFSNVGDIGCTVLRILGGEKEKYVRENFKTIRQKIEKRFSLAAARLRNGVQRGTRNRTAKGNSAGKNRKLSRVHRKRTSKRPRRK